MVVNSEIASVRLHFTNVSGLGAVRLLQSLLPALVSHRHYFLEKVYIPLSDDWKDFILFADATELLVYKRYLPNTISRLLECTLLGYRFDGDSPLLVLGDIPIKCKSKQTVFVQTTLLVQGADTAGGLGAIKYWIARLLFRRNIRFVSNFIVQTEAMKLAIVKCYPEIQCPIYVIAQPAPSWLIKSELQRTVFNGNLDLGLRLFYPAANYPHKNHKILSKINESAGWPVAELLLTIPADLNPNESLHWITCLGKLEPAEVVEVYKNVDALIFLSLEESFGFPLVEAMWIGLPIICPDRPYARTLCGEQAIYFDPNSSESLEVAVLKLFNLCNSGWWPDWSGSLENIPRDWEQVADSMFEIAASAQ